MCNWTNAQRQTNLRGWYLQQPQRENPYMSFPNRTGRPTRTGRAAAAPVAGPMLGPEGVLGPEPAVAGVWPGMLSRLNLGTTATLTLRRGRAWERTERTENERNERGFSAGVMNVLSWWHYFKYVVCSCVYVGVVMNTGCSSFDMFKTGMWNKIICG